MSLHRNLWLCSTAAVSLLLSGCESLNIVEQNTANSYEEVGSVNLAIVSQLPFSKYREKLKPKFKIDSAQTLLDKAVSRTIISTDSTIKQDTFSLGITRELPKDDSTSENLVRVSNPPSTPNATDGIKDIGLQQKNGEFSTPALAEMQKYWAATALYQEIQLLNHYLDNTALDGFEEKAYIVRIQLTTWPKRRKLSYDTYVDLGFFDGVGNKDVHVYPLLVSDSLETALRRGSVEQIRQLALNLKLEAVKKGIGLGGSNFSDTLQQIVGNSVNSLLSVTKSNDNTLRVRIGAEHNGASGYAITPRSHYITAVITGKQLDRSIDIIGESYFVHTETGFEISATQLNADKILEKTLKKYGLYPKEDAYQKNCITDGIAFFNRGEFQNFSKLIMDGCKTSIEKKPKEPLTVFHLLGNSTPNSIASNKNDVFLGDSEIAQQNKPPFSISDSATQYQEFSNQFKFPQQGDLNQASNIHTSTASSTKGNLLPSTKDTLIRIAWLKLANSAQKSGSHRDSIILTDYTIKYPPEEQVLTIRDTGKKSTLHLVGGKNLTASGMTGIIHDSQSATLVSDQINVNDGGNNLILTFPSLLAWQIDKIDRIELFDATGELRGTYGNSENIVKIALDKTPTEPDAKIDTYQGVDSINSQQGKGDIKLKISKFNTQQKSWVVFSGGYPEILENKGILSATEDKQGRFEILGNGIFKVKFTNLAPNRPVKVKVEDSRGLTTSVPQIIKVVASPASK